MWGGALSCFSINSSTMFPLLRFAPWWATEIAIVSDDCTTFPEGYAVKSAGCSICSPPWNEVQWWGLSLFRLIYPISAINTRKWGKVENSPLLYERLGKLLRWEESIGMVGNAYTPNKFPPSAPLSYNITSTNSVIPIALHQWGKIPTLYQTS